jgi:hypothetical protein
VDETDDDTDDSEEMELFHDTESDTERVVSEETVLRTGCCLTFPARPRLKVWLGYLEPKQQPNSTP